MSWLDHYHKNTQASSDATKVSPSSQQVDYQYASKVPFGTTNPAVPTYYKKQAQAQFKNQGQSSVIKKTDTSKQHTAQKLLNKVEFGNNDLANTVLDFTAKFPIQSGINLMNPQIRNDEDVARVGMDLLGTLPIINEAANLGVKGVNFAKPIYEYGNKAYKDAKVISDAEKLNNSLTPAYQKIKDIPEKIRRIGNIWSQPTVSYSEELDKLNRLKKLNVEEQHLKGITGLNKKQIDDRINDLNKINSSGVHMPENPTLDDLTNLIAYQNENGFDQTIQNYIDHQLTLNENRIRYRNDGQSIPRGNDLDLDQGSINLERPTRVRLDAESRELLRDERLNNLNLHNLNLHNLTNEHVDVPSWIRNTIDKHFNKGLISKINPNDAVISTNPSLYRSSQNVDEALKETQKIINTSPSGTKIRGASSLSDSSFPLVVSNIKRNYLNKNLKDVQFGGYNNLNFSGYLEKANIHPDVVVPYLNTHIDELSKTLGKKIPKAYYNDQGIFYPDLIGVKMQEGGQIKTNKMIQKHRKGGRVLGLYEMMGMPIPFKSGGLIKGIGGGLYGTLEGGLDAMSMGLTDSLTDAGANAIGGKDKTFNASRGAGNIAGAVGMDALTMGATHAGTVQQVAKGTNGLVQNTNFFGNKEKKDIGMGIDIFRATAPLIGGIEEGNVTSGQIFNSIQGTGQAIQNNNIQKKAEGGTVDKAIINVEKGELEVDPNTLNIVKEFRNKPKHPANGIDEQGNTMATVDNIIIPVRTKGLGGQPLSQEYKKASDLRKKAIINNLKFAQARREGIKYEYGGKIKKYDGSNGSVVGPRADGGFYNFSDNLNFTPSNPIPATTTGMFNFNPNPVTTAPVTQNTVQSGINFQPSNDISGVAGTNKYSTSPSKPFDWNKAKGVGEKALEYSPAIYNMARGIFDKPLSLNVNDYLVNDRVDAPVLTGDAGRRDLLRGYNLGKYNNRQLGGTQAGMNNLFNTYADATSKFNENLENTNKVAKFEASKYNIENKFRNSQTKLGIKQFNEQNKAEKRNQVSKALTQTSDIFQNERNNKIISNNLPNFLKYYNYNDKDGTFTLKTNTGGTK